MKPKFSQRNNPVGFALVLASGGIDSTACINFYLSLGFDVKAMFVDYNQSARKQERKAIQSISNHYNIELYEVKVSTTKEFIAGPVLGRNAFLYFTALMNFPETAGIISTGIHSGTVYYDCSLDFLKKIQIVVDGYCHGSVKVKAPFIGLNKADIVDYCLKNKIPIELTYSCEEGGDMPCGECLTCKDLHEIYARQ